MTNKSIEVNVSLDLGEIEDDVLLEEVEARGLHRSPSDFSDEEIEDELRERGLPEPMADAFASQAMVDWLRAQNPPQEIRDAFWRQFGRMLL